MTKLPSARRINIHYGVIQAIYWALYAAHTGYQAALLLGRGFSSVDISLMVSLRCLSGAIVQPLLGSFSDRHPRIPLRLITVLCLVISVAGSVLLMIPMGFGGTLAILLVLGALELSAYPLLDAMAVQFINTGVEVKYSLTRGMGSLAYAICAALVGIQVGRFGAESMLITHLALLIGVTVAVFLFPDCPPQEIVPGRPRPQSFWSILRGSPSFALMLTGVFFGIAAHIPVAVFFIYIIESRGGATADLGIALFLMAASELPTALFFSSLMKKFGSARLLVLSMAVMTVKTALMLATGSLIVIFLAQILQMFSYGLFTPASVFYVNDSVSEIDRVQGQTMMMVASNGLGGVLGTFVAGPALEAWGADGLLAVCIGLAVLATGITAAAARLGRRMPRNSG